MDPRCRFTIEQPINAPAAAVWQTMARPGNLDDCHPFCQKNIVLKWPGADSRDQVRFYNGRVLERRFTSWTEGRDYTVDVVDEKGRTTAEVTFFVREDGAASRMGVTVSLKGFAWLPGPLQRLLWSWKAEPSLKRYFACVLKGFDYHVTTGKRVSKNQFGLHREFSVP